MLSASFYTKIGLLSISEANGSIVALNWGEKETKRKNNTDSGLIKEARRQLEAFLEGNLLGFNLPISPAGSVFQRKVYNQLSNICFGDSFFVFYPFEKNFNYWCKWFPWPTFS